jgi:assimilatory nitrate reductase catalytic subunit
MRMSMPRVVTETRSTCCYCGTGCGVIIESEGTRITGVRGDPDHPANFGKLCSKGSTLHLTTQMQGRALVPELRPERSAPRSAVSWDNALNTAADRFARIIHEHGPDAVAFYVSGQLLTEDYYVFNKLARAVVGTNNIDSNSRLCMSSAVAGYKATLGADAVPGCYEDIEQADLFLVTGSNLAYAHPILCRRLEAARAADPSKKLIVVDPRRTDTAAMADLHLALQPGSDVLLYSAMLHVLLWEGKIDHDFIKNHTNGFDSLRTQLAELTPGAVAGPTGLSVDEITHAARVFGDARAPLSLWCQGLNQSTHGTANNAALIHLHLATGTIGKPGMGPFSLTGQPNAMGGREVGAMANLLPGHRALASREDRAELAHLWGVPELPEQVGLTAVELFDAMHEGRIKAVWIACTNPAHSLPASARVVEALQRAEFVVVQECFADTETTRHADLLLPATTWGEKDGTVTNSERRITRVRAAVPAPGEARSDWAIAADFAQRLQARMSDAATDSPQVSAGNTAIMTFANIAAVYDEHVSTTRGRDLDISALSHAVLDANGPTQWPSVTNTSTSNASANHASASNTRLYTDHRFAFDDGRARFAPLTLSIAAEKTDARYPFKLTTGRLRDQWHGMSRTGRSARLLAHEPSPRVQMNPADLTRRNIAEGALVRVSSRRGHIVLPVSASDDVRPGQVFAAMHWGARSLSHHGINALTQPAFDPVSKQPELKLAAVRIEPVSLPWRLVLLAAGDDEQVLRWRDALSTHLADFDYASLTLAGREQALVRLDIASKDALPTSTLDALCALLGRDDVLRFDDRARHVSKRARIDSHDQLRFVMLAGETLAGAWLCEAMTDTQPLGERRRWLFAPLAQPPGVVPLGRIVCNCLGVSEAKIIERVKAGDDLAALQSGLGCGGVCGSCVPELRRLHAAQAPA